MVLLIDIGNTSTHVALGRGKRIQWQSRIPSLTTPDMARHIAETLSSHPLRERPVAGAIICCVVPRMLPLWTEALKRELDLTPLIFDSKLDVGISIRYRVPAEVGGDRLANALAARELYGAPSIVVDVGTAVTFDVISPKGEYLGGVIAPGIDLVLDALSEKTALLPRITFSAPRKALGTTTESCISSGIYHGYRGIVKEVVAQLFDELGFAKRTPVIATGGQAHLILKKKLACITHTDHLITLKGLLIVYNRCGGALQKA